MTNNEILSQKAVSTIRALSIDMVEAAQSGHPGLPLGAAAIGYSLYSSNLKFNPKNPAFFDRDRFVLSAGHGTALLYSLLHLFDYNLPIDQLKNFRQLNSKTPGHPEINVTPGVDSSTGPLGQGIANAVGLAMAESILAAKFNRPNYKIVDHYTYALCGEGCLMEGIGNEAASLAGTWGLGKLIVLYDCNKITIEGSSDIAFDEDIKARHLAKKWQVLTVEDGNDVKKINQAIKKAKADTFRPSLIIIKTKIGFGSPKENLAAAHGAPLGKDGVLATKQKIDHDHPAFFVDPKVYAHCKIAGRKGAKKERDWKKSMAGYAKEYPDLYAAFKAETAKKVDIKQVDFEKIYAQFKNKTISTRKASSIVLNALSKELPQLIGGSADLGPSNLTVLADESSFSKQNRLGRNIHFGVREHAMAAIANGLSLHGGFIPYCATFFSFSDYMKNAIRMSAIMELPVIYVLTHDSIAVGEDGPTHQPIEHLAGLRSMPVLNVFRPCDGVETVAAYEQALSLDAPSAIVLSRNDLNFVEGASADGAKKGGYIVFEPSGKVDGLILSAGSEVDLCVRAAKELSGEGVGVRVVSMPCHSVFDRQPQAYKDKVLLKSVRARLAVEAGSAMPWGKYVGLDGDYVCLNEFGLSAKPDALSQKYGLTTENIVKKMKGLIY
ncbi:MAG: transketolase [Firmicutes bacterium]|nr:transketolase [Bacillota bacterium]